ncbi:MAG: nitrilase-related carbon-nitrogen hydrolase [Planctomycetota bacterium]
MQITAVQLNMAWEDREANHQQVRELLNSASIESGGMIILPEMFETGFSMNPDATAQSEACEGESLLREIAAQYGCAALGGVVRRLNENQGSNEAVAFAPDGSELVRYQKMQPFTLSGEDKHYPAGSTHKVFEWQGIQIAPFICYDLRFPERFRQAVVDGAELITLIACWPAKRSEHWVRLLQARAIENLATVIGVNRCGQEPGLEFDGRSAAFDHMGNELFQANADPQILTTQVDIDALRKWRRQFPALRDMRA